MFIRHAEAKNDILTDFGIMQGKILSEQIEDYNFTKIYSSPTNRCIETAKYYNENKGLDFEIDERLRERETLEREPLTPEEKLWYDNYMNPKFSSAKPEGCKELIERVYSFLDYAITKHINKDENFVIVSHSGIFYAVLSYFNKSNNKEIDWYKLGNASKVYFEIKK